MVEVDNEDQEVASSMAAKVKETKAEKAKVPEVAKERVKVTWGVTRAAAARIRTSSTGTVATASSTATSGPYADVAFVNEVKRRPQAELADVPWARSQQRRRRRPLPRSSWP